MENSNCKLTLTDVSEYIARHFDSVPEPVIRKHYRARDVKVPDTTVALLTHTSKMPGPSWGIPAHQSCHRANGDICAGCYAGKGCYIWPTTRNAQRVRFHWTRESMKSPESREKWIQTMVDGIRGLEYFRVHDSGDMFSPAYAESWFEVISRLPETKFWIPTRTWQQPSGPLPVYDPLLAIMRRIAALPNATVRPSALDFQDYAPNVTGLHAGTSADQPDIMRARNCPAKSQGGHCGDCRTCWNDKDIAVNYPRH